MDPKTPQNTNPDKGREVPQRADDAKRQAAPLKPADKDRKSDTRSPSERIGQQRMDDDGGQRQQPGTGDGQRRSANPAGPIPAKPASGKAPNFGDQESDDPRINDPVAGNTPSPREGRSGKDTRTN